MFFCVAALTRRIIVVYLQGVVLFAIYLILLSSVQVTNKMDRLWASVVDPLGLILLNSVTRYWTVAERNTQLVVLDGHVSLQPANLAGCRDSRHSRVYCVLPHVGGSADVAKIDPSGEGRTQRRGVGGIRTAAIRRELAACDPSFQFCDEARSAFFP